MGEVFQGHYFWRLNFSFYFYIPLQANHGYHKFCSWCNVFVKKRKKKRKEKPNYYLIAEGAMPPISSAFHTSINPLASFFHIIYIYIEGKRERLGYSSPLLIVFTFLVPQAMFSVFFIISYLVLE